MVLAVLVVAPKVGVVALEGLMAFQNVVLLVVRGAITVEVVVAVLTRNLFDPVAQVQFALLAPVLHVLSLLPA
jgi:hypothetical protein